MYTHKNQDEDEDEDEDMKKRTTTVKGKRGGFLLSSSNLARDEMIRKNR